MVLRETSGFTDAFGALLFANDAGEVLKSQSHLILALHEFIRNFTGEFQGGG